ncbi:MAG: DUF3500 domain-containing protein [Candidatus Omnitrophica bacterium]|nr:DUF3500 domain-containing protein [Candidatus Omnitrophota bacterium]MCB9770785.1 DUF3500 domain-containing protein [Candidatus Omnitrophota bacterium]
MFSKAFCILVVAGLTGFGPILKAQSAPVEAAKSLLDSCPENLKAKISLPFDSPNRTNWHYFPRERDGAPIGDMNEEEKGALRALLGTALSETGLEEVDAVMRLEQVLFDQSQSPGRDPGNYQLVIWGEPAKDKTWGWRFEGHHLSVNVTMDGDETLAVTPTFFGANPATVGEGRWEGFRALPTQEDLAREFMLSLPREQREQAIVEGELTDVASGGEAQINPGDVAGIKAESLSPDDRALLVELIGSYTKWFRPEVAEKLGLTREQLADDPELVFHWMGGLGEGDVLHTYRISGKSFDIQYANHQNAANHVHTLFRTIGHDFGE